MNKNKNKAHWVGHARIFKDDWKEDLRRPADLSGEDSHDEPSGDEEDKKLSSK